MSSSWRIEGVGLDGLDRVAAALALVVRPGDLIALEGDLGAGKTTFARALIGHIRGAPGEEIPSPTFALAQSYETPRMTVTHFDCYRLKEAQEVEELGLGQALAEGLALVEWPERVAAYLPPDRLVVALAEEDGPAERRRLDFIPHGAWGPRLERLRAMLGFVERAGWADARPAYLQGDASWRRYVRLARDGERAVLMDAPRQPDGPPIRDGKPYSALAHLAEDVRPFVAVATAVREVGLSAPAILAHDLDRGFLLLEDFGDRVFTREVAAGADQKALYQAAVDALLLLRQSPPPAELPLPDGSTYALPAYDATALGIETELLIDWFWPAVHGAPAPEAARADFVGLWAEQFARLARQERGWALRDFHSPNLIWLPDRTGVGRVGVLDFQDAVRGPLAYDLVALLQDARLDVPAALERDLFDYYCARSQEADPAFDKQEFTAAYAALGAQRNTKILGIFARLARRDGKRAYLAHIPRVAGYLERDLAHPALGPLKAWYDRHLPAQARQRRLSA